MNIRMLSIYRDFRCSCGDCRMDCCSGWRIPVDEDARNRYREIKGAAGLKFKAALKRRDGLYMFNPESGRCPFHTARGLCGIQLAWGEEYLPAICRKFPRNFRNYGEYAEAFPDLTCFHAAELFIAGCDDLAMEDADEESFTDEERRLLYGLNRNSDTVCGDDPVFLEDLMDARNKWVFALYAAPDMDELNRVLSGLVSFTIQGQEELARGNGLKSVTDRFFDNGDNGDSSALTSADTGAAEAALGYRDLMPLPIGILHGMLSTDLMQPQMERTSPFLYSLCNMYFDTFAGMYDDAAQARVRQLISELMRKESSIFRELRGFMVYQMYTEFLSCYNDYSLLRHVMTGIIEANLILLFEALWYDSKKEPDAETRARVMTSVLRRIRHNEDVRNELLKKVRKGGDLI